MKVSMSSYSGLACDLKRQRGASALAILIFLSMASLLLLVGFKLYPVYYDHWTIMSIAESFSDESDTESISQSEVIKRYRLRLQTNGVKEFNFDDSVYVEKDADGLLIEVDYERRVNIYKNVDAVVVFSEERSVDF